MTEFSRPIEASRLGSGALVRDIAADVGERALLARRFGLLALDRLEARVALRRVAGGLVRLDAQLTAELVQETVDTLEPVASRIAEEFTLLYGAADDDPAALDPEAEIVEPLEAGRIDLGEAVAQQLSLALDPYPRAPGTV
ncbi:MAG: YceD family protein [Stellaceae bacterium]